MLWPGRRQGQRRPRRRKRRRREERTTAAAGSAAHRLGGASGRARSAWRGAAGGEGQGRRRSGCSCMMMMLEEKKKEVLRKVEEGGDKRKLSRSTIKVLRPLLSLSSSVPSPSPNAPFVTIGHARSACASRLRIEKRAGTHYLAAAVETMRGRGRASRGVEGFCGLALAAAAALD